MIGRRRVVDMSMSWSLMLALQALAPITAPAVAAFDLGAVVPRKDCASNAEEIVVCGSPGDAGKYRLRLVPSAEFDEKPLSATMRIGNASAGLHGATETFPNGSVSNRVMVTVKVPF